MAHYSALFKRQFNNQFDRISCFKTFSLYMSGRWRSKRNNIQSGSFEIVHFMAFERIDKVKILNTKY